MSKNLYVIAGCNGAGKTTASFTILPDILDCREFVNADEIAEGLSPFQPEKAVIEAGKIMLNRIKHLLNENINFAFETTLATKIHKNFILKAQAMGYNVTLLFFWLQTVELAKKRVQKRVLEGGHGIEEEVIERRYLSGIRNLFDIYLSIVDNVLIFDNSEGKHELIAEKSKQTNVIIINKNKYNDLYKHYDNTRKN
ncbi:MAG: zeta toxin family protein [Lentimicrobiaceae bacterium]|nr:zeta toxin family protein [Lentimicrobiaceae bacterium]